MPDFPSCSRIILILTCLALVPNAAGGAEGTRMTGEDVCTVSFTTHRLPVDCRLFVTATLSVTDCDDDGCAFVADSLSRGVAKIPGYLAIETRASVAADTGASVCLGPDATNDALGLPCTRLCTSGAIGTETVCEGTRNLRIALPRGSCTFASVLSTFGYDVEVGSAAVWHAWHVCRTTGNAITITALG